MRSPYRRSSGTETFDAVSLGISSFGRAYIRSRAHGRDRGGDRLTAWRPGLRSLSRHAEQADRHSIVPRWPSTDHIGHAAPPASQPTTSAWSHSPAPAGRWRRVAAGRLRGVESTEWQQIRRRGVPQERRPWLGIVDASALVRLGYARARAWLLDVTVRSGREPADQRCPLNLPLPNAHPAEPPRIIFRASWCVARRCIGWIWSP